MAGTGGKRPGAGRKPKVKILTPTGLVAATGAALILAEINEIKLWKDLLSCKSLKVRLETAKYLTDRRDGKAAQAIEVSGKDGGAPIRVLWIGEGSKHVQ